MNILLVSHAILCTQFECVSALFNLSELCLDYINHLPVKPNLDRQTVFLKLVIFRRIETRLTALMQTFLTSQAFVYPGKIRS